jgi:predicted anti-sigma-YlaC factor YlaD
MHFVVYFSLWCSCDLGSLLVFVFRDVVCMYKGWAIKPALAPRPLMIYCASHLTAAMIITVAALRIVLAHGSKPT